MCVLSNPLKRAEPWHDSLAVGDIMALGSPWQVALIPGTHASSKAWKEGTCTVHVKVSVELTAKVSPVLFLTSITAVWACRNHFFSSATGSLTLACVCDNQKHSTGERQCAPASYYFYNFLTCQLLMYV